MIICLIGSIRNWDSILESYTKLSNMGNVVLLPVLKGENEELLMRLHKEKIDMSEKVFVVNKNGYMGRGTYEEIGYAVIKNKGIEFLEPVI